MKSSKKTKPPISKKTLRAYREVEPVMLPLLDLFADCDDVFTEEDALSAEHLYHTAGRIYRKWKEVRAALDPDFNPKDYEKRPRRAGDNPRSPLAVGSPKRSTARTTTSGKSRKKTAKSGKRTAKGSARRAR